MISLAVISVPTILLLLAVLLLLFPAFMGKHVLGGVAHSVGRFVGRLTGQAGRSDESDGRYRRRQQGPHTTERELSDDARIQKYKRILGLTGKVTPEKIKERWRELSKQYHPDFVQHLGPKLRAVAEQEMKAINEAYEYFSKKYNF